MQSLVTVGMNRTVPRSGGGSESTGGAVVEPDCARRQAAASAEELLELLGDEYAACILETVVEQPRTGREIVEATDISKATTYRRLERLENAGLVESTMQLDEDGHHCKQFHAIVQSVQVGFGKDGLTAQTEPADRPAVEDQARHKQPPPVGD